MKNIESIFDEESVIINRKFNSIEIKFDPIVMNMILDSLEKISEENGLSIEENMKNSIGATVMMIDLVKNKSPLSWIIWATSKMWKDGDDCNNPTTVMMRLAKIISEEAVTRDKENRS